LKYKEFRSEDGAVFSITKKLYISIYHIGFDLRYYPSYQGFEGSHSGASIFRPAANESLRYASVSAVTVHKHSLVS